MEQEKFQFSPLKPILLIMVLSGIYFFFSDQTNIFVLTHSLLAVILALPFVVIFWKYLRITFLMLTLRPAIILTDEAIIITERSYTIYWKDVMDVYMAFNGGQAMKSPRTYYIIIRVRDPEKYIKAIKNPFNRYFRWYTRNWSLSPFDINLSFVRGDEDEILHTVLKYYQNNRGF